MVQVARDGGIFSALSIGLAVLATSTSDDDLERTAVILDEALEVGVLVGDREAVAHVAWLRSWLAVQRGDWHEALRCALDATEQKLVLGEFATMSLCLGAAEIALAHLGALEASAVLYGVRDIRPLWADDFLDQFA